MRFFERKANFIREQAYQSFLIYTKLWREVAHLYMSFDDEWHCPEAQRAYERAMSQQALADFLDPQGRYNFYTRYRQEKIHENQ